MRPVDLGEMRCRLETAGHGNLGDRLFRLDQQVLRPAQPHLDEVMLWSRVQVSPEQPFKLSCRDTQLVSDLTGGHGGFDRVFHHRDGALQMFVSHSVA